jgi:hypothetical protein
VENQRKGGLSIVIIIDKAAARVGGRIFAVG